jgi:2-methylisocitrate lyase-like PEP mutase family enzyme
MSGNGQLNGKAIGDGEKLTYPNAWDVVTASVVIRAGRSAIHRSTHAVSVVFADKDNGQFPQLGNVHGLVQLTLISSTIAVQGQANTISSYCFLSWGRLFI